MWGFYALDYLQRHENQSDGNFYIDSFMKGGPKNLNDLKTKILKGETEWVDRLTYFAKKIKDHLIFGIMKG